MAQRGLLEALGADTLRRIGEMGLLDPRRVAAGAGVLPWLAGRGPSLGLLSQIHATSRPTRRAVVDRHGELTWWALDQRVNRLANALPELGVAPGDELALLLRNGREFCEGVLAAQKTGIVPSPLNTWAKARELGAILERSAPAALVYDVRHAEQLDGIVPEGVRLVHVGHGDALEGSSPYEQVLAAQRALPPSPITRDRGANRLHIHTSGTTGTPKTAARSTSTQGAASLLGLIDAIPYRHDDVQYIPNPMFHALGIGVFAIALGAGATMVLPDRFDPREAFDDLAAHRVTAASFVPVMLRRMLALDESPKVDLSRLRIVLVSGSAMPAELRERARSRFGDVLYDLYGSTEAGWIAIATPESMREAPDSVGKPALGVEVALLDEEGEVTDDEGEIAVRSAMTFEGYASGEDADERGGYLAMGDLGRFDERGYLYVLGRTDDMVVVGGENVYPAEVEDVIGGVDGVEDVVVLGVADEEMGEVLTAFIVGTAAEEDVRAACEAELASYKVPRRITRVDELPRTATGKVLRRELAEQG